jgi:hypothetical protein
MAGMDMHRRGPRRTGRDDERRRGQEKGFPHRPAQNFWPKRMPNCCGLTG